MKTENQWSSESTAGIISHMNEDHADAVALYLQAFGTTNADSSQVKLIAIDENGITLSYEASGNQQYCDIKFTDAGVTSPLSQISQARSALVTLVKNARKKLESH